jgi:hypothetical protein
MWLYASAATGKHQIKLYEYQPGRSQKYPRDFLMDSAVSFKRMAIKATMM